MSNNLFEILEIERGITADEFEANDDPGKITSPVWGLGFRIYFDFFFVVRLYVLQDSCTLCSLFRLCFVKRKQKPQKWTFIVSFPNRLSTKIAWIVSRNKSSIVCFSTFTYSFSSALSAAFYFHVYVPVSATRAIAVVPQPVELKPLSFAFLLCSA